MSTKTTFKRIALVAVAALGFGMLSVVPSSAAIQSDALTLGATTGTAVIGETATVTVSLSFLDTDASAESMTATAVVLSSPATSTLIPAFSITGAQSSANTAGTTAASGTVMTLTSTAAGRSTGSATLSLVNVAVAGTYVIRVTPAGGLTTTAQTWTVTVSAKVFAKATAATVGNTAGSTLVYGAAYTYDNNNSMGGTYATPDATNTAALVAAGGVSCYAPLGYGNPCLVGRIVLSNGSTVAADQMTSAQAEALTYKVTGPGVVSLNKSTANWTESLPAGGTMETTETTANGGVGTPTSLTKTFLLYTTGASGVITLTISSGTKEIAVVKATAFGDPTTITPTVVNNPIVKSAANTGTITAIVKDAAGGLVRGATVYAVSDSVATISNSYTVCGTSTSAGAVTCNLTAVAAGTANITLTTNASATATGGISSTPVAVRVSDGVATKVDYTFDKETYAPGETAKITATVSNAAGVMPAGSYTVLSAGVTANYTVSGLPTTTVLAVLNTGAATYTVTIPTGVTGDLQLIGTAATGITATFGKAAVVNVALDAANAATDAAAEATDAANAATDAANAAAEAADAATAAAQDAADAVAALATSVSAMIDALKKQITALTNLVIKIQKKVKA
jgi:hypothetical protein